MRAMLAAAVLGLALFGGGRAEAAAVEEIVALVHDVCAERGADRDAVETIAQERAWRALSRAELDAIPMRGIRPGFIEGWAAAEEGASISVTISASGVISAQMRERAAAGERITAPPPGEAPLDATLQDRLMQRERTQECSVRFSGLSQAELLDVRRAMTEMDVLGEALGEPAMARDLSHGLPPGERALNMFWPVRRTPGSRWMAVNYTIHDTQGALRGQVEINQPAPRESGANGATR